MKFKSIRQKLISQVSIILMLSFAGVLSLVAYLNYSDAQKNLAASEETIRESLLAKGNTLISNNSQALKGMAEDNAFSAVQNLVSSTVTDDSDILYGIFMDIDLQPWVSASPENPEGTVKGAEELEDEISLWVNELEEISYKLIDYQNQQVYEFAAPVTVDDEVLGHIRYGLTTQKMLDALVLAEQKAEKTLVQTIGILMAVGLSAIVIGFLATRAMAGRITKPLGTLTDAAGTIAHGDYASEVQVVSDDEIGVLANNFDTMRKTIQKKMQDLARINSTGEVLAVLLNQTKALEEVLKTMKDQTHVREGSVYLLNDDDLLELEAFFPLKKCNVNQNPSSFKLGEGVLGKAAAQKKIIYVPNTSEDDQYKDNQNDDARTLLCVPLLDNETLIGVMNFSGEIGKVVFEESDYEFANSIARLLVITVKNIRMREVIEEQNRTLEQKVKERTAELQEKTNDIMNMMQNMHQGLCTIMPDGRIHHEYAAYLEEIFETEDIAGKNFMDLIFSGAQLGSNDLDQIKTAADAIIGEDEMMFEFNSHLLTTEFTKQLPGGTEKIIELDWDPIVFDDHVDKLMVTVRDVTALKALQAEAEEQKRELEIIGHILNLDEAKFADFLSSAYNYIKECQEIIQSTTEKNLDNVATLFRNMHTVKGNARTYGFSYITDAVHDVETTYDELRKQEDKAWEQNTLLNELKMAETCIQRYEDIAKNKLGRSGESSSGNQANIDKSLVDELVKQQQSLDTTNLNDDVRLFIERTMSTLVSANASSISDTLADVFTSVESLAEQLGKEKPTINVTDQGFLIKSEAKSMLNDIFMHIFRNAIDHGIESSDVRSAKSKTPHGNIELKTHLDGNQLAISIKDDGQGLALGKIKSKAIQKGIFGSDANPSDQEVAQLIFSSGLSTAQEVSDVSGRGVGMDAVQNFLKSKGGSIQVNLDGGQEGSEYRNFSTTIKLPQEFYSEAPQFAKSA